jgi:NAD(P)-dependent dehydrogenase (short-subunit alcohol dehydrogenase family)
MADKAMNKPVTLITGASRGIGRATCVALAKEGHHIIALARTIGALEELADEIGDENITLIPQDISDGQALEKLGPMLYDKFGKMDRFNFIANAGAINPLCPLAQSDPSEWSRIFNINVIANVHLLRTLDPILKAAKQTNVVFITSNVADNARAYWGAYGASKAAIENMAEGYAQETENTNISVHIYNPGSVATKMWASSHPGQDQSKLKQPKDAAVEILRLLK